MKIPAVQKAAALLSVRAPGGQARQGAPRRVLKIVPEEAS
jgi:hypothetical protein